MKLWWRRNCLGWRILLGRLGIRNKEEVKDPDPSFCEPKIYNESLLSFES